jgi:uncharacterized protein (TIGR02391 family)
MLLERLQDAEATPASLARSVFADLTLHPDIAAATTDLFRNAHYANAVEDACKVLELRVKMRSGREDLRGTDLMMKALNPDNPALRFNDLSTDSDRDEQRGMMYLCAGVMAAFRNPRAHGLIPDDPVTALEVISFVSFLAKRIDSATRVREAAGGQPASA